MGLCKLEKGTAFLGRQISMRYGLGFHTNYPLARPVMPSMAYTPDIECCASPFIYLVSSFSYRAWPIILGCFWNYTYFSFTVNIPKGFPVYSQGCAGIHRRQILSRSASVLQSLIEKHIMELYSPIHTSKHRPYWYIPK